MYDVDNAVAIEMTEQLVANCNKLLSKNKKRLSYFDYWIKGIDREEVSSLSESLESLINYLTNSTSQLVVNKISQLPYIRNFWLCQPSTNKWLSMAGVILFPVGLPIYLIGMKCRAWLVRDIKAVLKVAAQVHELLDNK